MTASELLQYIAKLLGSLVMLCYGYQILYLFLPLFCKKELPDKQKLHHYAVLIAARNEERVLPYLLESIRGQDYPGSLVNMYVVADNCTDQTAKVAREGGAVCYTRTSTTQKGKGYALNYLLSKIREEGVLENYDAFLIFDADNLLAKDYITEINKVCSAGYDAFCGFRNSKNFGTNWVSAGHGLWFLHDSVHLNRSRMLLGLPCGVSGTGFGFTRELLNRCGGWNFFTLTEDIEFTNWCVTHGVRVGYSQQAELFDEQPEQFHQSWRQRTRWVQGGIQVSWKYGKSLLRGMLQNGRQGFACMEAATLSLWGYALGTLCSLLQLLAVLLNQGWGGLVGMAAWGLFTAFLGTFLMGGMTLLSAWDRIRATPGQKIMSLLAFPCYMLSYIPVAVTAIFRKFHWPPIEHTVAVSQKEMHKTDRE